jgi:hypothetical protein
MIYITYIHMIYIYIIWYISYIYIHMIYVFSNMMYDLYMCFIGFFKNEGYWSTTSHIFRTAAARGTSDGGRQSTCSSSSELCAAWKTQWLPVVFSVSFPSKNGGHIYIYCCRYYIMYVYIYDVHNYVLYINIYVYVYVYVYVYIVSMVAHNYLYIIYDICIYVRVYTVYIYM